MTESRALFLKPMLIRVSILWICTRIAITVGDALTGAKFGHDGPILSMSASPFTMVDGMISASLRMLPTPATLIGLGMVVGLSFLELRRRGEHLLLANLGFSQLRLALTMTGMILTIELLIFLARRPW